MKASNNEKQLGMAWYKFLIYFGLFAGAFLNFIYGVNYLTGGIYYSQTDGQFTAEIIYKFYGEILKIVDVIFGFVLIVLAFLSFVVRQKLRKYSLDAPKWTYVFYFISLGASCIYLFAVAFITEELISIPQVCSLIINIGILFFNKQYFSKRSHLFVGNNHPICYSSPMTDNENGIGEFSSFDNDVRINLSPIDEEKSSKVSGYHVSGLDIKFDNDIQRQNIFPSDMKSNYTYTPTNNYFTDKSDVKRKYCSRCGNVIDIETKKCIGCGKQYFHGVVLLRNNWKKIINIITVVFLIISIGINIVLLSKVNNQYTGLDKDDDFSYWSQNHDKVEFIDEHIVFVEDDGTDFYHKYECYKFVGNYFWAYNIELAEYNGYKPCPLCHDD